MRRSNTNGSHLTSVVRGMMLPTSVLHIYRISYIGYPAVTKYLYHEQARCQGLHARYMHAHVTATGQAVHVTASAPALAQARRQQKASGPKKSAVCLRIHCTTAQFFRHEKRFKKRHVLQPRGHFQLECLCRLQKMRTARVCVEFTDRRHRSFSRSQSLRWHMLPICMQSGGHACNLDGSLRHI